MVYTAIIIIFMCIEVINTYTLYINIINITKYIVIIYVPYYYNIMTI